MSQYFYTESQNESQSPKPEKPKKNYIEIVQNYIYKKWWLILLITVSIAFTFVSVFTYFALTRQNEIAPLYDNVSVKIEAPATISKGSPETWKISIENKELSSLSDVVVDLNLDPNFQYIAGQSTSIDNLGKQYKIEKLDRFRDGLFQSIITFKGTSKGNVDEDVFVGGTLSYNVDNLIRLQNANRLPANTSVRKTIPIRAVQSKTTAAKIAMLMSVKDEIVSNNNDVKVNLEIENLSEKDIKDLRIRYYYPQGFTYRESLLTQDNILNTVRQPDEGNNIWNIANLQRLNKRKLSIEGSVFQTPGASLSFRADVEIKNGDSWESVSTIARDITIAAKPLAISTRIETSNFFTAGQTLNFIVNYENQGTNTVKDAQISATVQDPANLLDWSSLQFDGGNRGSLKNNSITWSGNNLPQLANLGIRSKGELKYSVKVKNEANFLNTLRDQSEYILIPQASANGKNIQPIQVNGETYKAQADISFKQTITPLQFADGQTNRRKFRVLWEISTRQNKVDNVIIRTRSILNTDAWNPSSVTPAANSNQISYNPQNGEIVWAVGNVLAYSGISNSIVSISFDLEVEKPVNFASDSIELYKEIAISGVDNFNGTQYSKAVAGKSIEFNATVPK